MLYFTSDLHLSHINPLYHTNRPFSSVEEMNAHLLRNINDTVGEEDELWVLGDFSYKASAEEVAKLRSQIRCRHVHLVVGNHDDSIAEGVFEFESVQDYRVLDTEFGFAVLCHYPFVDWYKRSAGSIHLHGHIHSLGEYNARNLGLSRIYDVGVDANDFRPISLDAIALKMGLGQD